MFKTKDQRGAYILILALLLPACLMVMCVLIDLGFFYTSRAHMQNVADAAALAGAQQLQTGANQAAIIKTAEHFIMSKRNPSDTGTYPKYNYVPDATVLTDFSEDGDTFGDTGNNYCRVTLSAPAKSILMRNILDRIPEITVQAVAFKNKRYAVFAGDGVTPMSTALNITNEKSTTIDGLIHSNNGLYVDLRGSTSLRGRITFLGKKYTNLAATNLPNKLTMPDLSTQPGDKITVTDENKTITLNNSSKGSPAKPKIYTRTDGDIIVKFATTASCYASFYAPNGNIIVHGSSLPSVTLHGGIVAKTVDISLTQDTTIYAPDDSSGKSVQLVK